VREPWTQEAPGKFTIQGYGENAFGGKVTATWTCLLDGDPDGTFYMQVSGS
jgi:hypothetical protein